MLDLISTFIGTVITTASGVVFGKYILKEEIKTKLSNIILIILSNSLLAELLYILGLMSSKVVIVFVLNVVLFKVTFKIKNTKAFMLGLIFYLLIFASEIVFLLLVTNLLKLSGNSIYIQYGATLFGNLFVSIMVLGLGYLLRKFFKLLINIKVKKNTLIYYGWSSFCVVILLLSVVIDSKLGITTFVILGVAVTLLITIFMSLKQSYKHHELTLKYDKLLEFIKKYELEIDKQRTLRHETRNQFVIIKSKIIDKDKESNIIEYINEIIEDNNQKINNSEYSKLGYLPSNGIKGLFYFKVSEASEKGIDIKINISKQMEQSFLNNLSALSFNQVGKVLGIFLDNAIEGALSSDDKQLGIEIYCEDEEATFIISNTYLAANTVSTNRRSTKGMNRGHGLLLAKQIINLNPKLSNETTVTESVYVQKLTIKK